MWRYARRVVIVVLVVLGWEIVVRPVALSSVSAVPSQGATAGAELARLFDADQADRKPEAGRQIDWVEVGKRDQARLLRVRELYKGAALRAGAHPLFAFSILTAFTAMRSRKNCKARTSS